jgi:hypothetical protein
MQFVAIFHVLTHGCPMIDYEDLKDLFQLFKVKSVSRKHWSDTSRWGMVKVMHVVLLEAIKATFATAPFIAVNVDEVTMMYVLQKWRCIPIFLCVEVVSLSTTSNNVFSLMFKCMLDFCGLRVEELVGKLVSIDCDMSNVFQGHQTSMTTQFKNKVAPFIIRVHYFAH